MPTYGNVVETKSNRGTRSVLKYLKLRVRGSLCVILVTIQGFEEWLIIIVIMSFLKQFEKRTALRHQRFELYDIYAKDDPVKLGFLVPEEEKIHESPFPESHLLEADDEVYFTGVNSKSESILVRISRVCNQKAEAWIYLKLADGTTYCLPETSGYQISSDRTSKFSCGRLSMYHKSPMRRWRIYFCGMLNRTTPNGENEYSVFVQFVFLWKASSKIYDWTLNAKPEGLAHLSKKSPLKYSLSINADMAADALNVYAQTGTLAGTVSVDNGPPYEMYLFGEKIRNLAKKMVGSSSHTIFGCIPSTGYYFHLSETSVKYYFGNLQTGFLVNPDGEMQHINKYTFRTSLSKSKNPERHFEASFNTGIHYEMTGFIEDPFISIGDSRNGFVKSSMISFVVGDWEGLGMVIEKKSNSVPESRPHVMPTPTLPPVIPLSVRFTDDAGYFEEISGGKGMSLCQLTDISSEIKTFIVPKGIVVTTAAYKEFLSPEIYRAINELENAAYKINDVDLKKTCHEVSQVVENAILPPSICKSIKNDLTVLFKGDLNKRKFAIRSSATGKDTAAMSNAGQMATFLGIQGFKEIFTSVKKCWASQFCHTEVEYKRRYGQVLNFPMAVIIQEMISCYTSGAIFTCDPLTNNPSTITITSNNGLGETLMSEAVDPDTYKLRKKDWKIERLIGAKQFRTDMDVVDVYGCSHLRTLSRFDGPFVSFTIK
ncbi:prodigiosin synthesizing transferase PigC [Nephila pilipes]|uniref:Prodigiosin synthesizing transferase PigC n=1 Tax=Nephila pilipes TaxID=299642 RepID=A0A8X6PAS2_NEPPI|nr:prodigiosin synthesizing transferase PigC [Nephila pilipes]